MTTLLHRGHAEIDGTALGATLTIEPGCVSLEIATQSGSPELPERVDLVRFTSNTGYFTLITLSRRSQSVRFGVGTLTTYRAGLAFESGYFPSLDAIRSPSWSMYLGDMAKIIHVNGIVRTLEMPPQGGVLFHWTIAPATSVVLECPTAGLSVRLGQDVQIGGTPIDGPTIGVRYPAQLVFAEAKAPEAALRTMHRVRQFFSMIMGRLLPILSAAVRFEGDGSTSDMPIHGLHVTEDARTPEGRLIDPIDPVALARMLDLWLTRYDELTDAIQLHMSGLEQHRLPIELRFQIFVQALEALHRRTAPSTATPIDVATVRAGLQTAGIAGDVVDRVAGMLAHAHEPGLRQRLRYYWDRQADELAALQPQLDRKTFIGRVAATRNYYAHRTDRDNQVFERLDLWDVTHTIKAMSHMALLQEIGADITGIGVRMSQRRFVEYALRE